MDRLFLIKVLKEFDNQVNSHYKIVIVGGAAMIIYFGSKRATRDGR